MRGKKIVFTIFGFLLIGGIIFTLLSSYNIKPVVAQAECPSNIHPDSLECLDYLRNQLGIIEKQQGTIQKQLKDVEYQKLSLAEKIDYTNELIYQIENGIKKLQIEISATDIEIGMLEKDIKEKEDDISTLRQEIIVLSDTVNERVTQAYKYSFLDSIAVFLDFQNAPAILRRIKYLEITREQDKAVLGEHTEKTSILEKEEQRLSETKEELQEKRDLVESERVELGEQKLSLDAQKRERESLLAQAKAKETELLALYQQNMRKIANLDKAIINYINTHESEIVDGGWVTTNTAIGRMGNTGCSDGSHLHLGLNSGKKYVIGGFNWGYFWSDVNLFNGGYLKKSGTIYWPTYGWNAPILISGSGRIPFNGPYVFMHQDEHQGNAIDMASYSSRSWGTKIESAPVYPIMPGQLYKGTEGVCGGKYAQVMHTNGMVSIYLHLE